jgi:hypothetical protein
METTVNRYGLGVVSMAPSPPTLRPVQSRVAARRRMKPLRLAQAPFLCRATACCCDMTPLMRASGCSPIPPRLCWAAPGHSARDASSGAAGAMLAPVAWAAWRRPRQAYPTVRYRRGRLGIWRWAGCPVPPVRSCVAEVTSPRCLSRPTAVRVSPVDRSAGVTRLAGPGETPRRTLPCGLGASSRRPGRVRSGSLGGRDARHDAWEVGSSLSMSRATRLPAGATWFRSAAERVDVVGRATAAEERATSTLPSGTRPSSSLRQGIDEGAAVRATPAQLLRLAQRLRAASRGQIPLHVREKLEWSTPLDTDAGGSSVTTPAACMRARAVRFIAEACVVSAPAAPGGRRGEASGPSGPEPSEGLQRALFAGQRTNGGSRG